MDIEETIKGRRSIRDYEDRDIPDSVVKELLLMASYAPSSMNGQPWHFVVIRDEKIKERLVEIKNKYCPAEKRDFTADFLRKAPVIIVICVDKRKSYDREIENGVLAAANLMLAAYSKGLGSVYMSAYRTGEEGISRDVRNALNIPPGVEPISIVPLGYPNESPEPKVLQRIEEIISYETYYKQ